MLLLASLAASWATTNTVKPAEQCCSDWRDMWCKHLLHQVRATTAVESPGQIMMIFLLLLFGSSFVLNLMLFLSANNSHVLSILWAASLLGARRIRSSDYPTTPTNGPPMQIWQPTPASLSCPSPGSGRLTIVLGLPQTLAWFHYFQRWRWCRCVSTESRLVALGM